jgi:hypothetical protein
MAVSSRFSNIQVCGRAPRTRQNTNATATMNTTPAASTSDSELAVVISKK